MITSVAGVSSQIGIPVDLALDGEGDIFFTQTSNSYNSYPQIPMPYVSELKHDGTLVNIAGIGVADFSGDGGPAAKAALDTPSGLALDAAGNLYIFDSGVGRVRKVNSVGRGGLPISPLRIAPVLNWATPAAITYGTPLSAAQLNATASVPGTFAYLPVSGTVLGAGSQTLTATFTPTDTTNYNIATATVTLTVNSPPVIALQPTNQTVTLGNTATFTAAATGTPALTYAWQYFQAGAWHNWQWEPASKQLLSPPSPRMRTTTDFSSE